MPHHKHRKREHEMDAYGGRRLLHGGVSEMVSVCWWSDLLFASGTGPEPQTLSRSLHY